MRFGGAVAVRSLGDTVYCPTKMAGNSLSILFQFSFKKRRTKRLLASALAGQPDGRLSSSQFCNFVVANNLRLQIQLALILSRSAVPGFVHQPATSCPKFASSRCAQIVSQTLRPKI